MAGNNFNSPSYDKIFFVYHQILAKTVLNKSKRRDAWFLDDYTLNPYSACSFNCLYCYVRGSKYGINMAEKLSVKTNAPEILDKQLTTRARKNQYGMIVMSSATDPYLQIEKDLRLTRQLLEIIHKHRFPVHIITKSDLVIRDLDILRAIAADARMPDDAVPGQRHGTLITFSFSTLRNDIAKTFEPGAVHPTNRLEALRQCRDAGFHCGASLMPLLPFITDTDDQLHEIYAGLRDAGARYAMAASLTLFGNGPSDSLPLMLSAIQKHYPQLEPRYRSFFKGRWQVPWSYRNALQKKLRTLSEQYALPMEIPGKQD